MTEDLREWTEQGKGVAILLAMANLQAVLLFGLFGHPIFLFGIFAFGFMTADTVRRRAHALDVLAELDALRGRAGNV